MTNIPKSQCCEKCRHYEIGWGGKGRMWMCFNAMCECHKQLAKTSENPPFKIAEDIKEFLKSTPVEPSEKDWAEEFDERSSPEYEGEGRLIIGCYECGETINRDHIKDFIRTKKKEWEQKSYEEGYQEGIIRAGSNGFKADLVQAYAKMYPDKYKEIIKSLGIKNKCERCVVGNEGKCINCGK